MFLAAGASKGQLFAWHLRPRSLQGTCLEKVDADLERELVLKWALSLTDMPKDTHHRLQTGEMSEFEDVVPGLPHCTVPYCFEYRGDRFHVYYGNIANVFSSYYCISPCPGVALFEAEHHNLPCYGSSPQGCHTLSDLRARDH